VELGSSTDGAGPLAGLLADANDNLFGATCLSSASSNTNTYGTVFKLTRPAASATNWTESIIANLSGPSFDGGCPQGGLIADKKGNLYGTTVIDGVNDCGTVFELFYPGSGGRWTGRAIYTFPQDGNLSCGLGGYPTANLIIDQSGNLYGTTSGGGAYAFCDEEICPGTVFKLSPPAIKGQPWNLSILWSFGGTLTDGVTPFGNVIMDSRGNLYGTTAGGGVNAYGTAFELTPPATSGGNWDRISSLEFYRCS